MQIILAIIALSKTYNSINEWIHLFMVEYSKARVETMSKENRDAIKDAFEKEDQRNLERAMGSIHSGEPSGVGEIVDHVKGVQ
jgi:hypothetical protein